MATYAVRTRCLSSLRLSLFKLSSSQQQQQQQLQQLACISTTGCARVEQTQAKKSLAAAATQSSSGVIPPPQFDGQSKEYSPKITRLVDDIAQLNLIEVSELNELLRKRLNIKDVAVSYAQGPSAASVAQAEAAKAKEEAEQAEAAMPKAVKSSFRLKIVKYDETRKVNLIKEIKALGENMNLVQAKKLVESLPQVFKDNINKDEVEKLKEQLEKAGAVCEIE